MSTTDTTTGRSFAISHHNLSTMDVNVVSDGRDAVATLAGEADMSNADQFAALITGTVAGCQTVRIDIAGLTFLDSSMLRALLICQAQLAANGVDVKVCRPTPQARQIFELTSLTSLLDETHA